MDHPLVSVVIPVYNGQAYVGQAVESVFAQTYPNLEVIAVDDGSTDNSAKVLAGCGPRLKTVRQENQGVAAARNAGIERATGQFVAFLDQDDWWRPEKVQKQVDLFLSDDRIGLVHTGVAHWDEAASDFTGPLNPNAQPELLSGACFRRLVLSNPICNSSVAVRTSVLKRVGLCDRQIRGNTVQDYDLWLRIARRADFGFVPDPLVVLRVHSGQGTWNRRLMYSEAARLLERVIAAEGLAEDAAVRRRMARLYDDLGTAYMDAGDRKPARQDFARSIQWRPSARAVLLWSVNWLPVPVIRALQAVRGSSPGGARPHPTEARSQKD